MTVAEAQDRVSSEEFAEWIAFHGLDPWTRVRDDHGFALLATVVANALGKKRRKVADFLPDWERRRDREYVKPTLENMCALFGVKPPPK